MKKLDFTPASGPGGPTVIWVTATSSDISSARVGWTSELRKEIIDWDILSQHEICGGSELSPMILITVVWPGLVTLKLSNSFRIRKLDFLSKSEVINIVFSISLMFFRCRLPPHFMVQQHYLLSASHINQHWDLFRFWDLRFSFCPLVV